MDYDLNKTTGHINIPTSKIVQYTQAERFIIGLEALCKECNIIYIKEGKYTFSDKSELWEFEIDKPILTYAKNIMMNNCIDKENEENNTI